VPGFQPVILGIALASMVLGNLAALKQTNIKRLLAYSTIAHAGYMLLGLVTLSTLGLSSLLFYLVTYLFMNLGAFGVVIQFQNWTGSETIADYAGLVQKRPGLALIFTTLLLSLSGIPITSGFFAKFFLFQSVAAQGQYLWVVIVALLMSTVSLYYYLNVVRLMVIAPPSEVVAQLPDESAVSRLTPIGLTVAVCLVMTLALGVWSETMIQFTNTTMQHMTLGTLGGNMLGMVP
jgi:NADH:ubiquinone oxidoreductase subunit 2 (subunit N)